MSFAEFSVFNVEHFPAVWCCSENVYPGYGARWQAEIEALVEQRAPFYMVFIPGEFNEAPADTRVRAVWLKQNKAKLASVCKSVISIEADSGKRAQMQAQCAGLEKAFGVPRLVCANLDEAEQMGMCTVCGRSAG